MLWCESLGSVLPLAEKSSGCWRKTSLSAIGREKSWACQPRSLLWARLEHSASSVPSASWQDVLPKQSVEFGRCWPKIWV